MARMKVLLTEDVPSLGLAGEVHTVARGYARNYLIPRREAILATKGALKQAEDIRASAIRKRAQERSNADAQAEVLSGQQLLFNVRAGENDRLYGSITTSDIAERIEETVEFEVDRRRIVLNQPIRELGLYDVTIRLMAEVEATFAVAVVREGEGWADAEQREQDREAAALAEAEEEAVAELVDDAADAEAE
ncbi:MAG: 50S ribosomal protein L9 [Caldilineaceae bacterium SB0670_bin_27]|uniref:Large ribosomal subunit protein bL9 n=1 Tax=Caldilineaceae bacterium SB0664_bin_27 TaxID=2605260 RepID=A0A6B0YZG7_9CHLR|nr:50S ribosomal protein L9 [Caldilineaceae bacterium SB0664_bin_27]MYJ80203.1 50S ribosomal protein L9 [Caldilineaceae bacterium SB0670_bin_27]